jgi:hypothetical protein
MVSTNAVEECRQDIDVLKESLGKAVDIQFPMKNFIEGIKPFSRIMALTIKH